MNHIKPCLIAKDIGLTIPYLYALEVMEQRIEGITEHIIPEMIWFLQHPPLYTAGTSAELKDIVAPLELPIYQTGRGGRYTWHGPGQRIVYCLINLKQRQLGVREYVQSLQSWIIRAFLELGVHSYGCSENIGVWANITNTDQSGKLAAIGVRIRKGIAFHGFAINLNPDMQYFKAIIPCGIADKPPLCLADIKVDISMDMLDQALLACNPFI